VKRMQPILLRPRTEVGRDCEPDQLSLASLIGADMAAASLRRWRPNSLMTVVCLKADGRELHQY
jgi:hypothetical protein